MNPLINENTKVKIKKMFNKKNNEEPTFGTVDVQLIGMNNAIPICAEACACCWDRPVPEDYFNKANYIAKRSKIGHTSVLEHSNYVLYISVDSCFEKNLIEFLGLCKYLNKEVMRSTDGSRWHLILGGSFRAYSDLYREANDLNNPILKAITGNLYTYANSSMFEDICELGLMDKNRFIDIEPDDNFNILTDESFTGFENDLFKIIGIDDVSKLYTNLYKADKDAVSQISTYSLSKFATITVLFKNMSRTCTHQLVRHRNAITQESQRYVDYSKSCFSSPDTFKPDKYDSEHKYTIRFGPSSQMHLTLSEIGKAMCDIYSMLSNPAITGNNYALLKEDARAFLPSNVQCKKIYVTFTYKNLFKFLDLREDKAAQAEIRMYAESLGEAFRSNTKFNTKEIIKLYTKPNLLIEDPFKIDLVLEEKEEINEITEEDYIKAIGLDPISEEDKNNNKYKNGDDV